MKMERKKELINQYKARKISGGVYRITNKKTGKYLLSHAVDLKGSQNLFNFSVATNSCVNLKLQDDWMQYGKENFTFEILEAIDKEDTMSDNNFEKELETLEEIWREKLGSENEY